MDLPLQSVREEKKYIGAHPFQLTVPSTPTHRRTWAVPQFFMFTADFLNSASIKDSKMPDALR
jgi:hypothetical protein